MVKRAPVNVRYLWRFGEHILTRSFNARDPERKSSKASLDHFAGAYFSFSNIRIARMICRLPQPTKQSPATCRAHAAKLVATLSSELSPQHENCQSALNWGPRIGLQRVGSGQAVCLGCREKSDKFNQVSVPGPLAARRLR
jgi:hypothetical protein